MKNLILVSVLALSGCAAIEPNSIRVYGEHVSHATQHFESTPTDYGYNAINVEIHYQHKGAFLDIAEGIVLNRKDTQVSWCEYGAMAGPRELFTARVGYEFQLK